jgi:hypothetical protein
LVSFGSVTPLLVSRFARSLAALYEEFRLAAVGFRLVPVGMFPAAAACAK